MKVTVEHPKYPKPLEYPEPMIRFIARFVNNNATMEDAEAADKSVENIQDFPVATALQSTLEGLHGMVSPGVAATMFHIDLDEDGTVDLTIDDVGELMRFVSGKAKGELKKESAQYQAVVQKLASMIE